MSKLGHSAFGGTGTTQVFDIYSWKKAHCDKPPDNSSPIFHFAKNRGFFTWVEEGVHRAFRKVERPGRLGSRNAVDFKKGKISLDFLDTFFINGKKY